MIKRKTTKKLGLLLAAGAFALVAACLALVSTAKVEVTDSGVHTNLRIPIGDGKAIRFPLYTGTGDGAFIAGYLAGPIVRRSPDGSWNASWFCQDKTQRATGTTALLQIDCAGRIHSFSLETVPIPDAVASMPQNLVVLSDLEGNSAFLEAALQKLDIVDEHGHWQFGQGQIVILGDSVDRGRNVFAVLWRLHDLAGQAQEAGGAVRIVLGNHDQYMLRNMVTKTHPEYRYAAMQLGGFANVISADTVIGAWLRKQPVVLKLGSVLFAHGGISPQVMASGLSIGQINNAMRSYWPVSQRDLAQSTELDAVLGQTGVTQYRGYFRAKEGAYPAASQTDVAQILAHFNANQIVVAHTLVDEVTRLHQGKVIAVDVNHAQAQPQVLVYRNGIPEIVDVGLSRGADTYEETHLREFSLLDKADRQLLGAMFRVSRSLSGVPQPY